MSTDLELDTQNLTKIVKIAFALGKNCFCCPVQFILQNSPTRTLSNLKNNEWIYLFGYCKALVN